MGLLPLQVLSLIHILQDNKENYYIYAQTMNGKTQYGLVVGAYVPDYMNGIIKTRLTTVIFTQIKSISEP